jgi:hypothetical protein
MTTYTTRLAQLRTTEDLDRGEYISPEQVLADTPESVRCVWHDDDEFRAEVLRVVVERKGRKGVYLVIDTV